MLLSTDGEKGKGKMRAKLKDNRALQHTAEGREKGELRKAKESLIYFIQWILKMLKRGAWQRSLLDLFHTIFLSHSLLLIPSLSHTHTWSHTQFSFRHTDMCLHNPDLSINQSVTPSPTQNLTCTHCHYASTLETHPRDHWPLVLLSVLSFTLHSHLHRLLAHMRTLATEALNDCNIYKAANETVEFLEKTSHFRCWKRNQHTFENGSVLINTHTHFF